MAPLNKNSYFAFVAILGETNAGKSTLVNRLVGSKISIVSPKVQTTRTRIRGILVEDKTQLVLVDTPGIFNPKRRFDRAMIASAFEEADESDICLLVVDAKKGLTEATQKLIDYLIQNKKKAILALNKIDALSKDKLLPLIAQFNLPCFSETFLISAQTGENVDELKQALLKQAKPGPWLFEEDQLTDLPNRLFAAEVTREKLFLFLGQELPYAVAVQTTAFTENKGAFRIEQTIFVERDGQKSIVLGKNGTMIKKIGSAARAELTEIFERPVHLFLFVKVKQNWSDDRSQFTEWGLDFNA